MENSMFGSETRRDSRRPGSRDRDRDKDRDRDERGGLKGSKSRFRRKKVCRLCADGIKQVDYKDTEFLLKFLTEKGKIIPRRITGNCAQHQRILAGAVKRSRHAAIVPFVII